MIRYERIRTFGQLKKALGVRSRIPFFKKVTFIKETGCFKFYKYFPKKHNVDRRIFKYKVLDFFKQNNIVLLKRGGMGFFIKERGTLMVFYGHLMYNVTLARKRGNGRGNGKA